MMSPTCTTMVSSPHHNFPLPSGFLATSGLTTPATMSASSVCSMSPCRSPTATTRRPLDFTKVSGYGMCNSSCSCGSCAALASFPPRASAAAHSTTTLMTKDTRRVSAHVRDGGAARSLDLLKDSCDDEATALVKANGDEPVGRTEDPANRTEPRRARPSCRKLLITPLLHLLALTFWPCPQPTRCVGCKGPQLFVSGLQLPVLAPARRWPTRPRTCPSMELSCCAAERKGTTVAACPR
mmetsp:Transcript_10516/g.38698  ORF Transcript_10516/g.38698 Transcript_10516/m.38698 type:complete len:239 (-) Transcript_10516:151-867(-)